MASPCPSTTPLLTVILVVSLLCFIPSPASSTTKVSVSLYYETLCPYCSDFIVNNLAKIFQNGLISITDLNLVPYGNARVTTDGSIMCQHGTGECILNVIEACAMKVWPDTQQNFPFIQCIENLVLTQQENNWQSCFLVTGLSPQPIVDCYNSGLGMQLEEQYGDKTNSLQPPHEFVPWLIVNGNPLHGDYMNFEDYICKAYDGTDLPDVCKGEKLITTQETDANNEDLRACLASEILS